MPRSSAPQSPFQPTNTNTNTMHADQPTNQPPTNHTNHATHPNQQLSASSQVRDMASVRPSVLRCAVLRSFIHSFILSSKLPRSSAPASEQTSTATASGTAAQRHNSTASFCLWAWEGRSAHLRDGATTSRNSKCTSSRCHRQLTHTHSLTLTVRRPPTHPPTVTVTVTVFVS